MVEVGRYDMVKIIVEQYGINLYHEAIEIASDRDDSHDFLAWAMLDLEKKRYRCGCGAFWPRRCADDMAFHQTKAPGDTTNLFEHLGYHDLHLTYLPTLLEWCPKETHPKRHAWLTNYARTMHLN